MPSPIAHGSIAIAAHAALGSRPVGRVRTLMVWGLLLFACVAPDMDIPIEWARTGDAFALHGTYSHSLLLAPAFGVLFALAMRLIAPVVRTPRAFAIGTALYALHVLMDLVTMGSRGVSLFWPLSSSRIASPIAIFVGVEHTDWKRLDLHLLTLVTEGAFALVVWGLTRAAVKRWSGVPSDA